MLQKTYHSFHELLQNKRGNFAIVGSLLSAGLIASAGFAIDYSSAVRVRSEMQNALDAAVVGALINASEDDEQIELAKNIFAANTGNLNGLVDKVTFYKDGSDKLTGVSEGNVPTSLLKIIRKDRFEVDAKATGIRGPQAGRPLCIMAMHPTRKHTLELKGSVSIYGPDCNIYGNSDNYDDVIDPHTPQNYITGASVQAVGYGHHYIENITPAIQRVTEVIKDPFLTKSLPSAGSCDHDGMKISGSTTTINPGTYCNGLEIDGSNVTLNPGLYVITYDDFVVHGSTLKGDGVTIHLADRHVEMDIKNSELQLVAPTTGTYQSFVMMGVREQTENTFVNSTLDLYGIVYIPNAEISWQNSGTPTITAEWAAWIADGFSWDGNGTINFPYKTDGAKVPFPDDLNVIPWPNIHDIVRLLE